MARRKRDPGALGEDAFGVGHTPAADRAKIDRFLEFHRDHPVVFALFRKYALELYAKGFRRYSADALLHAIRYMYDMGNGPKPDGRSQFPLVNDHFSCYYADQMKQQDNRFERFFPSKRRTST